LRDGRLPAIILVTAYDHFALRAFEIGAVDYLLKPFNHERFQRALRRARHRLQIGLPCANESSVPCVSSHSAAVTKPMERVTVTSSGRVVLIKAIDIDWVSSSDNYVELHVRGKSHLLRTTISDMANRLPSNQFARISRSILVNLDGISEIQSRSHGDFL